jgi:MFS family permease
MQFSLPSHYKVEVMKKEIPNRARDLPSGVWILGLVSMLMDSSSELVHSLLPTLMVSVLGASMVTVGFVEGMAEATAAVTKIFSGALSDYWGKRKNLVVAGYGLGALTKPLFPLASSIGWIFAARFVDRVGKGIRGAPRDALVADITSDTQRGKAYGLRQSLDTVGAFVGPLLALGLMNVFAGDIRLVLWVAVVPGFAAVLLLLFAIHEPSQHSQVREIRQHISFSDARDLGRAYWIVVLLGAMLTLARFSEAFLLLRTQSLGLSVHAVPLTLVVMNAVYALSSYPAGRLADRMNRHALLSVGVAVLILSDLTLATSQSVPMSFLGVGLWGLHMGLTQGLLSTLVAHAAPQRLRGYSLWHFQPCKWRVRAARQCDRRLPLEYLRSIRDFRGGSRVQHGDVYRSALHSKSRQAYE